MRGAFWPIAASYRRTPLTALAGALLAALALALLPLAPLTAIPDALRALLAILLIFVSAVWLLVRTDTGPAGIDETPDAGTLLEPHERLEQALDVGLSQVIDDTESSAVAIMQQLRDLHDSAASLVTMLINSRAEAERLDADIAGGLAMLTDMRELIVALPDKISANLGQVRAVAEQIRELNGLAELVHAISTQSHLLAINAAIEAHRAGESGRTFRVVANEVKNLAANSGRAATEIGERLSSAWNAVESGMQAGIDDSLYQLQKIVHVADTISALERKHQDFSAYYREQFTAVTGHNESLATAIVDTLGRAQYQDVVRQAVDRIRDAAKRRNAILAAALSAQSNVALAASALASLCDEYQLEERRHANADHARDGVMPTGEAAIELF